MAKVGFIGTVETPESCHASALYHPRAADTIVRTRRWSWWRENPKILVDCSSRREQRLRGGAGGIIYSVSKNEKKKEKKEKEKEEKNKKKGGKKGIESKIR